MEFGENLKQAREEKGITQQTLAQKLYVTRQAVSKWECGSRYPDLLTTKCIANILDVSIDSLVSNDEMKDFSEKQSIAQGTRLEKLMTALYAVVCVLSLALVIPKILSTVTIGLGDKQGATIIFSLSPILQYILIGLIATLGLIKSLKQDLTPKISGAIGIVFYSIMGLKGLIVELYNIKDIKSLILCIIVIAIAPMIYLYFIRNKQKLATPLIIIFALSIAYFTFSPIYEYIALLNGGYIEQYGAYAYIIDAISSTIIISTMLMQLIILNRKRRINI